MACGLKRGDQKGGAPSGCASGSCAKSQPPAGGKGVQFFYGSPFRPGEALYIFAVVFVTTKIFPGETGGRKVFDVFIGRRSTPIYALHGASSQSRTAQGYVRPEKAAVLNGFAVACLTR